MAPRRSTEPFGRMKIVLCLLLLPVTAHAWGYGKRNLIHGCVSGYSLSRVEGYYDPNENDRVYTFECNRDVGPYLHSDCFWAKDYVNQHNSEFIFKCPEGHVITGSYSTFNSVADDRKYKFKCCPADGIIIRFCYLTGLINDWVEPLDYNLPIDRVIQGFWSEYRHDFRDRRWKAYICRHDMDENAIEQILRRITWYTGDDQSDNEIESRDMAAGFNETIPVSPFEQQ